MPTQIEHISPYHAVRQHEFENLVLLCANCHQDVTARRRSKASVCIARAEPYALKVSHGNYTMPLGEQHHVDVGSLRFRVAPGGTLIPFLVGRTCSFAIKLGNPVLFFLRIFGPDGNLALEMNDNVLSFTPTRLWDVRLSGSSLKVRYGAGKVLIDAKIFDGVVSFSTLKFVTDGWPFYADKHVVRVGACSKGGFSNFECDVGINDPGIVFGVDCSELAPLFTPTGFPKTTHKEAWDFLFNKVKTS